MKRQLIFGLLFLFHLVLSQQTVTGIITDENDIRLNSVTVINMSTDQKVLCNSSGEFSIEASGNDELRFVKAGYERASKRVLTDGVNSRLTIILTQLPQEIEEVQVVKLSGDLSKDSRKVAKVDLGAQVEGAVGLPQPVGKMRETPAEVKKVLLPMLLGSLNIQGLYDLVSGKARKQKRQYQYEDLQEHIAWIKERVDDDYFVKAGIPVERISEFIEFSFLVKPHIRTYVKAKNLSAVLLRIEEVIPLYTDRLKESRE
ncbi:hypothetical protein CHRYSEOSP005_20620 [Chryseobacterium sp. Alg-005]|uniref:carboxypeptidase-like regulatory domain-containing protein n=1 Tax=Chryseobacterium sp. Alg-005 TaxID=3159516 RepID=UPI003555959D